MNVKIRHDLNDYLIVGGTLSVFGIKNSNDLDYFALDNDKQLHFVLHLLTSMMKN